MRVAMFAYQTWGHHTLRALLDAAGHEVALVVTHPAGDHAYERRGERMRITRASISRGIYGGTPGRIFIKEGDGVVVVAGSEARRGRSHGLLIEQVRTDDGTDLPATEYFRTMGGYLTAHPAI
ncbi:hypothetical protein [Thermomonospora umbrina]|uniref:Methionyl-tRNA formyltransferase n=1 Tax=Thermomonospora umbrina TaxID=111806 RepID=A0A3D9SZR2_9ACTN|nr:hypothetical protein [Thermomonospora umbrina]REF00051.1 hypothetical protein DFJ69_5573 [Thermomonospora umbrina]